MTTYPQTLTPTRSTRVRQRLAATGVAVAVAVAIWIVAVPLLGVDLRGPAGPLSGQTQPVILPAVISMSLGAALAAWALLAILERRTGRARYLWNAAAFGVLVISYGGPLFAPNVPTGSRITLALMHTAVGLVLIALLPRTSRAR